MNQFPEATILLPARKIAQGYMKRGFFGGGFRGRALERVVKSASAADPRALALGFFVHLFEPCQDFLALPFCSSRKQFIGRCEYHHHSPLRKKACAL